MMDASLREGVRDIRQIISASTTVGPLLANTNPGVEERRNRNTDLADSEQSP
jgi:hypothetical protein